MTLITAAKETSVSVDVGRYVDRVSADILTESRGTVGRHQRRVSTDARSTDALSTNDPGKLRLGALDLSFCNTHNYPSTNNYDTISIVYVCDLFSICYYK